MGGPLHRGTVFLSYFSGGNPANVEVITNLFQFSRYTLSEDDLFRRLRSLFGNFNHGNYEVFMVRCFFTLWSSICIRVT